MAIDVLDSIDAEQAAKATGAIPGTAAKIAVFAARVANGVPLYHPEDARCRPLAAPARVWKPRRTRERVKIQDDVLQAIVADLKNDVSTYKVAEKYGLCRGVIRRIQKEEICGIPPKSLTQREPIKCRPLDMPALALAVEEGWY